ncbi:MAG: type II toxin-antitoxin system VapC family toxin [Actinomycetota bacterium]
MPTGSDLAYLDASAIVKLIVDEDESQALRDALGIWPRRATSQIAVVEVIRAVRRRDPGAEPLARTVLSNMSLLAVGARAVASASVVEPPTLRSMDALHVATALRLGRTLAAFVSYETRQVEAAEALRLPTASPR